MLQNVAIRKTIPCGHACAGVRQAEKVVLIILFILSLASRSAAEPQATLKVHPQKVPINREVRLTLELTWSGEADVYDIPQPDSTGLTEFQITGRTIYATRRGNENHLKYEFTLKPMKEGEYDLGQIQVNYFEKGKDIPTPLALPRTPVKVVSAELLSPRAKAGIGAGVVLGAAAVAMVLVVRSKKVARKKKMVESHTISDTRASLLAKLDGGRPLLLEGKVGEYLEYLCGIAESGEVKAYVEKADELRNFAESVKFGGQTASPDQLSWAEKLVRAAIQKAFPYKEEENE